MSKSYCIFSALYLPHIGGVEKYTQHLSEELVSAGNSVTIVTNNIYQINSVEQLTECLNIIRLPCTNLLKGRLPIAKSNKEFAKLYQQLKSTDFDYVIINTRFYPHTLLGMRLAESQQIRPVIIEHGSAYLTFNNIILDMAVRIYEDGITRKLSHYAADYYGVSQACIDWLNHFGISAKGILSNSIDADAFVSQSSRRGIREEFSIPHNAFIVTYIGRLIEEKGIKVIIDAATQLQNEKDIFFLIAGEGPLLSQVENTKAGQIFALGKLSDSDVSALLQTSDAFCLPSRSEGFSTSLLEAAACGTAPIVTQVGGVTELIPDERFGEIVSEATGAEVAKCILFLRDNPEIKKQISENLKTRVRDKYTWKNTAAAVAAACTKAQTVNTR